MLRSCVIKRLLSSCWNRLTWAGNELTLKTFDPGRGVLPKKLGRGVRPASQTLTLFMTKICDFPYPIYDLTKNLIPYLWPVPYINTLLQTCLIIIFLVQTSVKGNVYLLLLVRLQDCMCKEVAPSKKNEFKTTVQKSVPYLWPQWRQNGYNRYPIYDQNGWKTIPFGAAHTYIAHIREYPPPPGHLTCSRVNQIMKAICDWDVRSCSIVLISTTKTITVIESKAVLVSALLFSVSRSHTLVFNIRSGKRSCRTITFFNIFTTIYHDRYSNFNHPFFP